MNIPKMLYVHFCVWQQKRSSVLPEQDYWLRAGKHLLRATLLHEVLAVSQKSWLRVRDPVKIRSRSAQQHLEHL